MFLIATHVFLEICYALIRWIESNSITLSSMLAGCWSKTKGGFRIPRKKVQPLRDLKWLLLEGVAWFLSAMSGAPKKQGEEREDCAR
jgi:hypothetical protein